MVGMCGAGKAINASMFAAAIGIDRSVERYIGGLIARDDRFRLFGRDSCSRDDWNTIDQWPIVEPVTVINAFGQGEPVARLIMRCAA